ncbi:MAG: GldG family protein [Chitinispirillales bacterium]|jgi:gliding-associated putative ABC transporter substrate-binding component GldG|nr:GldG family protein [Chitinispirillales bacterium]
MKKQKIKSRVEYIVMAGAVIVAVALVNYFSDKVFYRLDLTENRQYTVSDATKRVLKGLDDIVTVKAFFSKELPPETHITVNTVRDLLSEYKNIAGGKLRVTWEDPAGDEEAMGMAMSLGVPEIRLQTFKRDKAETMVGYMGIGIMYADKKESIPIVQNLPNLEYDLTQAIMKVKRSSAPKIGVLKSQTSDFIPPEISGRMNMGDEKTEKKFAPIFESFKRDYEVVAVDVSEGKPIDKEIRTLIVPNGDRFNDRALFEIDQYFMNGGNIIALVNATEVSFQYGPQGTIKETKLLEILEYYGVRVERNMIMDASCGQVQVPRNLGMFTINELLPYPYFIRITRSGFSESNPVVSAQSELMLGWASSLTLAPDTAGAHKVTAATLASSSEQSWEVTGNFDLSPQPNYQIPPKESMKPHAMAMYLNGAFKSYFNGKPVPPAKEKTSGEEEDSINKINLAGNDADRAVTPSNTSGNLVVVGDANFITSQNASGPNVTFMMNLVDWLSLDNNLISVRARTLKDKTINPNILEAGSAKPGVIRAINLLLMPILVVIAGIVISLRRREKIAAASGVSNTTSTQNISRKGSADE